MGRRGGTGIVLVVSQYPPLPPQATLPTCYRHPGQAAGVVCQRCDRPICPQCMNTASVGFHCPECVHAGAQKVYQGPSAMWRDRPLVTQILMAAIGAVFVVGLVVGNGASVIDAGGQLFVNGSLYGPLVPDEPWRLVTGGFLHAGIIHLAFNMYALWVLGRILEPAIGRLRFGAVYGASLLAGSLGALILDPATPTVGASGAIFGLMGATLVVARRRGATQLVNGLMITLGINLLITLSIPNISIGGHIGGVIGGAACGYLLLEAEERTKSTVLPVALVAGVGVAAAAIAYALMASRYG